MTSAARRVSTGVVLCGVFLGLTAGLGAQATVPACRLMTKDEIKKALGPRTPSFFDQIPVEGTALRVGSECSLGGVMIQLDAVPAASFDSNRQAYAARTKYERFTGIGDDAYFFEQGAATAVHIVGVYARVGSHVVAISMDVDAPDTVESTRPAVTALTKLAMTKLK